MNRDLLLILASSLSYAPIVPLTCFSCSANGSIVSNLSIRSN